MKISIFGLGYVGVVTAAILTKEGNKVIGVDVNKAKIDSVNQGKSPIVEKDVDELIKQAHEKSLLEATDDVQYAIANTDVSVVCVGTPSSEDGSANLTYIKKVMGDTKTVLSSLGKEHTIIVRSTIPPHTMEKLILPMFGNLPNVHLCFNPEFLREGTAVADYYSPPYIIAAVSSDKAKAVIKEFYKGIQAELIFCSFATAEILKVVCNIFHALIK